MSTQTITFAEILKIQEDMNFDSKDLPPYILDKITEIKEASEGHARVLKVNNDFHVYIHTKDMSKIAIGEESGKQFIKLIF